VHRGAVGTLGERDTEDLGGSYGGVAAGPVEIPFLVQGQRELAMLQLETLISGAMYA